MYLAAHFEVNTLVHVYPKTTRYVEHGCTYSVFFIVAPNFKVKIRVHVHSLFRQNCL